MQPASYSLTDLLLPIQHIHYCLLRNFPLIHISWIFEGLDYLREHTIFSSPSVVDDDCAFLRFSMYFFLSCVNKVLYSFSWGAVKLSKIPESDMLDSESEEFPSEAASLVEPWVPSLLLLPCRSFVTPTGTPLASLELLGWELDACCPPPSFWTPRCTRAVVSADGTGAAATRATDTATRPKAKLEKRMTRTVMMDERNWKRILVLDCREDMRREWRLYSLV